MYRVLLSSTGKAYVKDCEYESDNEFMEELQDFVYSGDPILVVEDTDVLKDALSREYEIVLLDDDAN